MLLNITPIVIRRSNILAFRTIFYMLVDFVLPTKVRWPAFNYSKCHASALNGLAWRFLIDKIIKIPHIWNKIQVNHCVSYSAQKHSCVFWDRNGMRLLVTTNLCYKILDANHAWYISQLDLIKSISWKLNHFSVFPLYNISMTLDVIVWFYYYQGI